MRIKVRVHGHAVSLLPDKKTDYEFEIGEPVALADFLEEHLEINPDVFATFLIGGKSRAGDYLLDEDCEILLISPLAGG